MSNNDQDLEVALELLIGVVQILCHSCKIKNGEVEAKLYKNGCSYPKVHINTYADGEITVDCCDCCNCFANVTADLCKCVERIARHCSIHIGNSIAPLQFGGITIEIKSHKISALIIKFRITPNELPMFETVIAKHDSSAIALNKGNDTPAQRA